MDDIKGLNVDYIVLDSEGRVDNLKSGTLLDFKSTPSGIVGIVLVEDSARGSYTIDVVPVKFIEIPKSTNKEMLQRLTAAYIN